MKKFKVILPFALRILLASAHSWIENVESIYGEGASRVGMDIHEDGYLQRYFCPLSTLEECQPDPKHNIVLQESAMRPCRPDMISDPRAGVRPGTDLTLHWAGNGHVGNGQSDGTCVTVMIAPFEADPSLEAFDQIPGAGCLDFGVPGADGSQQPQGTITIPETLPLGSYTLLWYWNFTEFWYSACIDIDIADPVVVGSPPPSPVASHLSDGEIQVYLHNGCANMEASTEFCRQYTTAPESFCSSEVDECGRSVCHGVANFLFPCPVCPVGCPVPKAFYDDFSNGVDETRWLVAEKSWGGGSGGFTNGGVVAENVVANVAEGTVAFNAHGNFYAGDVMGINRDLTRQTTGVRTGGAMASRQYFGAGSYEIRMKVAGELGVCSAIWTFFYNDDEHCSSGGPIINHEIDIELPGRPSAPAENMDFSQALTNTWIGESGDLHETGYTSLPKNVDDDKFHIWRFDWHTDVADRRVDFFLDGDHLVTLMSDNIPFYAGRLWIGAWFPNAWAGEPDFAQATMEVDYVKFTPFDEYYECLDESYPDFGWAPGTSFGVEDRQTCNPGTSPPAPPSTSQPITPGPSSSPVTSSYLDDGCSGLPSTFCASYIAGSYCKDWQQDGCGRSVCHGDSHDALNPCSGPPPPTGSPATGSPTESLTGSPTIGIPTRSPMEAPTISPVTGSPTRSPNEAPVTGSPTGSPTDSPSRSPSSSPITSSPSKSPSDSPVTDDPRKSPTNNPTNAPSGMPTDTSTPSPTRIPTQVGMGYCSHDASPCWSTSECSCSLQESTSALASASSFTSGGAHWNGGNLFGRSRRLLNCPDLGNRECKAAGACVWSQGACYMVGTPGPTKQPTGEPTDALTNGPTTGTPTDAPMTSRPTDALTSEPTSDPTGAPTLPPSPCACLGLGPTRSPTDSPTTGSPARLPTDSPATGSPVTGSPTRSPNEAPVTGSPTGLPTGSPIKSPSDSPITSSPNKSPSDSPVTGSPSKSPTDEPSNAPTKQPNVGPTTAPTNTPSDGTKTPTASPTDAGTDPDWIYANEGCTAFSDMDVFCRDYNGGYCKYWQSDECGRSICKGDSHRNLNPC